MYVYVYMSMRLFVFPVFALPLSLAGAPAEPAVRHMRHEAGVRHVSVFM